MHDPPRWRDRRQNDRLIARECQECGYVAFPEDNETCKRCRSVDPEWQEIQLAEKGVVKSYVVQQRLPDEFETPLPLAMMDMPQSDDSGEAARVYGLFTETDPEDIDIGMTAVADFREVFELEGLPVHSYKFKRAREDRL